MSFEIFRKGLDDYVAMGGRRNPCLFPRTVENATLWPIPGGREIQKQMMSGKLPECVLRRPKDLQAVVPPCAAEVIALELMPLAGG